MPASVPSDLTPQMTIADLRRVYETNCEPFESVAQCDLFLRAANMLWSRLPAETEGHGERLSLRDIQAAMQEARKARGAMILCGAPATCIVPPNDLR